MTRLLRPRSACGHSCMPVIDLTHILDAGLPVYPGDPAPALVKIADVAKDGFMDFKLSSTMHVGTHIDAPAHMLAGAKRICDYPPDKFFGRGVVIDARGKSAAGKELLSGVLIAKGDIVLVNFGWSSEFGKDEYYLNYPEITESLAAELAKLGVSMIGLDTPSPDRAPYAAHKILFKNDILIMENLTNLEQLLDKPRWEIAALPMNIEADSAFCRVVARIA